MKTYTDFYHVAPSRLKHVEEDLQFLADQPVLPGADASVIDKINQYDIQAMYQQNLYYAYHWILIFGALATTVFGVISALSASDPGGSLLGIRVSQISGAATAITGLFTAFYTYRNNRRRPQYYWYSSRRKAEALRRQYYLFLARIPPYSGDAYTRRIKLRDAVLQIDKSGQVVDQTTAQQPGTPGDTSGQAAIPLSTEERKFLTELYRERRIQRQLTWYQDRSSEYTYDSDFTGAATVILIGLAGIFGSYNTVNPATDLGSQIVRLLAIALPAVAAAFGAFQQVYGWDRQDALYQSTLGLLNEAAATLEDGKNETERSANFARTVVACEAVFASESDQWGQGVPEQDAMASASSVEDFTRYAQGLTPDQKNAFIKVLQSAGGDAGSGAASGGGDSP